MRGHFDIVARVAFRQHGRVSRKQLLAAGVDAKRIDRWVLEQDKVDCHWPELDLTIELVTYRYHATRQAFESDVARQRRNDHLAYTYGDVIARPTATAAELRPLLTAPGS